MFDVVVLMRRSRRRAWDISGAGTKWDDPTGTRPSIEWCRAALRRRVIGRRALRGVGWRELWSDCCVRRREARMQNRFIERFSDGTAPAPHVQKIATQAEGIRDRGFPAEKEGAFFLQIRL